jgi:hypothetical protein
MKKKCVQCDVLIKKDEVALTKKLLGDDSTSFYCVPCLAIELDCDPEDLKIKIQEFKEQGCTLFL